MTNEELVLKIKNGDRALVTDLWQQIRKLVIVMVRRYLPMDGSNFSRA